jgi:hypothetical protein
MNTIGITLEVVKFAVAVLAGAFGVLALLTKHKDDDGEITYWGRVALYGVIDSTLLTISMQVLELARRQSEATEEARKAREAVERSEKLLAEIRRSTYRLHDISITVFADAPLGDQRLAPYQARLEKDAEAFFNRRPIPSPDTFISRADPGPDGALRSAAVTFTANSPLFPRAKEEAGAYDLLSSLQCQFFFFKDPSAPLKLFPGTADLSFPAMAFALAPGDTDRLTLTYDRDSKTLEITATSSVPDRWGIHGTGRSVSIPDLAGSRMVVTAQSVSGPAAGDLGPLRSEPVVPQRIVLTVRDRHFWFRAKDFTRVEGPLGEPGYSFQFPNWEEGLHNLADPTT